MKKLLLALLLFAFNGFAQLSKTHYIPPVSNSADLMPQAQFMYISTPSQTDVKFKITNIGGNVINGLVSRDKPYAYDIGEGQNTQVIVNKNDVSKVMNNKGFIVEAEDLVYVNVRIVATPEAYHAGSVVSKGMAALGTQFRIGAFTNKGVSAINTYYYTFASILATENNTVISFKDIKPGVSLINNPSVGNFPSQVTLNRGESYVMAVQGPNDANRDGLIGAGISSTKPVAVNCGSFGGSNGTSNNLDLGFDQIVPAERTGQEYIFIKGNGVNVCERPVIVANEDNTEIYLGNSTTAIVLNEGKYIALDGSDFSGNGSLYVRGSKKFFAYQGIGGTANQANQNMHFLPPLSCETPKVINNIPFINEIGDNKEFKGTVNVVVGAGATLSFIINGTTYPVNSLPAGVTIAGPKSVTGNTKYETYSLVGLTGNVSVISNKEVYLSYFGSSDNATYGGYYSGFVYKPEINFGKLDVTSNNCLPNVNLSVNKESSFEEFQWFFNDTAINGATNNNITPKATAPGFYKVVAKVTGCNIQRTSDDIPVSVCLDDSDADAVSDNTDIDNDNDGIANCDESPGITDLDLSGNSGTITKGNYSNSFDKIIKVNGSPNSIAIGGTEGELISQIAKGTSNSLTQTLNFANPVSLVLEYVQSAGNTNRINGGGDFVLQVPFDKTITVLNPDDQLLIDTNYDGIYESGVKEFFSFQIRFRLKDVNPLEPGTGTFKFLTRLVTSISLTHKNLSESNNNNAIFKLGVTCLPQDADSDGTADELDPDDENDGIPTLVEVLGKDFTDKAFADANKNGMDDGYEPGLPGLDSDNDGVFNYFDIDSDNDGIYDLTEAGFSSVDTDNNGLIDAGMTAPALDLNKIDVDGDKYQNFIDSDSDGDGCVDVQEAGFPDPDHDGYLGDNPVTVDPKNGKVTSATGGYTILLNDNYVVSGAISITKSPNDQSVYVGENAIFEISSNADTYQWQVSTDGVTYTSITDDAIYSGSTTATLQITNADLTMNGYKYQVVLNRMGSSCPEISSEAVLKVSVRPIEAPKFFTPNGDGTTDYWNMNGVDPTMLENSRIDIFDRFGKLLYVINDLESDGWDGTYNGKPLPANDYWYVVYLKDKVVKGHFSLIR